MSEEIKLSDNNNYTNNANLCHESCVWYASSTLSDGTHTSPDFCKQQNCPCQYYIKKGDLDDRHG